MNNLHMLQSSLWESSSTEFEILAVHSYDENLEIQQLNILTQFYLSKPIFFKVKVIVLCFYKSLFVALVFNTDGEIINSESGIVDDEVVLSNFGFERNEE